MAQSRHRGCGDDPSAGDPPALSNIAYDDLAVDERMGPFTETVSRGMARQLAGPIGIDQAVTDAPPAMFPILLFRKALRRAMGGILAGRVLANQELEFHATLPVDSEVEIVTGRDRRLRRDLRRLQPAARRPEVAARSEFGAIIAHGPIALHSFFRAVTGWLGTDALTAGSAVKVTYRAPTCPGDEITAVTRERHEGGGGSTDECVNQDGTTVVSITAVLGGA